MSDQPNQLVDVAKAELSGMAKDGMHHPSTKPVLTGAAVGAGAALVLGFSIPLAAVAGAGLMFYNQIRK